MVTGIEAAGIALAVIPLALQGYSAVRDLASQYSCYNRTLFRVLVDIETYEGLFKEALDQLLSDMVEEDSRNIILANLGSGREYWYKDGLEEKFRALLGGLFQPIINSIQGVHETLEEVKRILLKLSGEGVPRFKRLAIAVAATTCLVIKNPLQLQIKDIQIQSTRRKVASIIKGTQGKLRGLRDNLKHHNESVLHALQLRKPKSTRRLQRPINTIGNMVNHSPKGCLNAKAIQLASRQLYGLTSKALPCDCHLFHLRLDRQLQGNETLSIRSKGKSKMPSPAEPETRFWFRMIPKPNSSGAQDHSRKPHLEFQLVFTSCDPNSASPAPRGNVHKPTICEEVLASNEAYKRHFCDCGASNISFMLEKSSIPNMKYKDCGTMASTSLNHLVISRPDDLSHFDQLSIAVNLASSVLFYSTPWLQNWSLQTVHFFEKQEQPTSTPGLWTPHLYLTFDNQDQSQFRKNGEIYSLGLVLLGLGRKKLLDYSQDGVDSVLRQAVTDVCMKMGADYQRFVKQCLYVWGDQNSDLMDEQNLKTFLFEITVLQTRLLDFMLRVSED